VTTYFAKLWVMYCDIIIIDLQLNWLRLITNGFITIEQSIEYLSVRNALFEILGIFRKKKKKIFKKRKIIRIPNITNKRRKQL